VFSRFQKYVLLIAAGSFVTILNIGFNGTNKEKLRLFYSEKLSTGQLSILICHNHHHMQLLFRGLGNEQWQSQRMFVINVYLSYNCNPREII